MPLTRRTDGNNPANIISSSWFNDFLDLLTGKINDQQLTIDASKAGTAAQQTIKIGPTVDVQGLLGANSIIDRGDCAVYGAMAAAQGYGFAAKGDALKGGGTGSVDTVIMTRVQAPSTTPGKISIQQ